MKKIQILLVAFLLSSFTLGAVDWKAQWIGESECKNPIELKSELKIDKKVRKATVFVSARGLYQAYINGVKIGDDLLTPGWTSYNKRIQYQEYDVTALLSKGTNAISATVAPGWYSGGINWGNPAKRFKYGKDIALILQLEIEYRDGTRSLVKTDSSWQISPSEVTFAGIYDGQTTDLTLEKKWRRVEYTRNPDPAILVPSISEPVRRGEPLKPVNYIITPSGEKVIDFGQNISGWERFRIQGHKGDTIRIKHAEILGPDGNFYTKNLRDAKATSTYVLSGGTDTFEPLFTFYGFRYIKIEGLAGDPVLGDFEAVPICSDFPKTGTFECSNPVINQLQSNISWSFRDNFVDVPTDCPQRDERLGWTGDAQVFFRTATFLGKVDNFFRKWLADLSLDQRPDGNMPRVIPDTFPKSKSRLGATGWADCATLIPWQHYMAYGDKSILEAQYASMKAWVDWCIREAEPHGWLLNSNIKRHFGDWLSYSLPNDPGGLSAVTSKALVAQSFFAASTRIMASTAAVLGRLEDRKYYEKVDAAVREAYLREYVTAGGMVMSDTQTAYVLALHFDLLPDYLRKQAADRLVDNIHRYKDHITTGFLGTPYICEVLTDTGHSDLAYKLLMNEDCPGWLYQVLHGATTIWERWDSIRPDGTIIDGMNSFNHYSFGSIGDWLYRSALGIRETSPGYRTIEFCPHAGGGITYMKGSTQTPYGRVAAEWTADKEGNILSLSVEVPKGTTATVRLGGRVEEVGAGKWEFRNEEARNLSAPREYGFTQAGIIPDGTVQTTAIQALINKAAEDGGGVVVVPAGTFVTGTLNFRQGVSLRLEEGAVLKGSDDLSDYYFGKTRIEGETCRYFGALIQADGLDGFSISGKGTIDGNGLKFHKAFWLRRKWNKQCTNKDEQRPRLVYIDNCTNTTIEGISLKDSPFWTMHFHNCKNLILENLTITSRHTPKEESGPSTDAIDLDVVENAVIRGCNISVNDDGVALKGGKGPWADDPSKCEGNGPNRNILIENCSFGEATHCCLTIGSESVDSGDIIMRNCTANCPRGIFFRYKMRRDTPQVSKNILIENCKGDVDCVFRVQVWNQFFDLKGREDIPMSYADGFVMKDSEFNCRKFASLKRDDSIYKLSNISFVNVTARCSADSVFDKSGIENYSEKNLKIL